MNEKEKLLNDLQNNVSRYEETTDFVGKQNSELHELLDAREKELDDLRDEIRHLQVDLNMKDKKINDQSGLIAVSFHYFHFPRQFFQVMSAEASSHVSTSSGSAPVGADDDEDSSSASYNRVHRQYTKANSTLGVAHGMMSERTNLRKSLSNFALNAIKSDVVTAGMSQNLRCVYLPFIKPFFCQKGKSTYCRVSHAEHRLEGCFEMCPATRPEDDSVNLEHFETRR